MPSNSLGKYIPFEECDGCSILDKNKPKHAIMDHDSLDPVDVLFLSDSVKWNNGDPKPFRQPEMDLIIEALHPLYKDIKEGLRVDFAGAVKCPNVIESDMETTDIHKCRNHLYKTIDKLKPTLVFTCGNLAMKMLIKKSGLTGKTSKRGRGYEFISPGGHRCDVVPIFHPFGVVMEPKNRYLFELDIRNGYRKYIKKIYDNNGFTYTALISQEDLKEYEWMWRYSGVMAIDIETTGLDWKRDKIQTIAFSYRDGEDVKNICVPLDHANTPFPKEERGSVLFFLSNVLGNKDILQVYQNGSFDRKFLRQYGLPYGAGRTHDTKIIAKLIRENSPNGLKSMVTEFFADELPSL